MLEHLDLTGMDPRDAREYVYQYLVALKKTRADRDKAAEEVEVWRHRVDLARGHDRSDLEAEALTMLDDARSRYESLTAETRALEKDVMDLKDRLHRLEEAPSRTIDAEALLSQLESVAGTPDTTSEAVRELEADAALEELKRRMQADES